MPPVDDKEIWELKRDVADLKKDIASLAQDFEEHRKMWRAEKTQLLNICEKIENNLLKKLEEETKPLTEIVELRTQMKGAVMMLKFLGWLTGLMSSGFAVAIYKIFSKES